MLEWIAYHVTHLIVILGVLHLGVFVYLLFRRVNEMQRLKSFLGNIVRELSKRADIDHKRDLDDEIHFFITDIRDVLQAQNRKEDRQILLNRLVIKDEARPYLTSKNLETGYNVTRTGIEAYPLLGILGTILAIAVGLGSPAAGAAGSKAESAVVEKTAPVGSGMAPGSSPSAPGEPSGQLEAVSSVSRVVQSFLAAIWSTAAGLIAAIILMLLNALLEPGLMRLNQHRAEIRDVVRTAKRELGISAEA